MYLSVNNVVGLSLLLCLLIPPPAKAMCVRLKSYLAEVEIHSCKVVDGERDLLLDGIRIQYFELNRPISMLAGSGEVEAWILSNSGDIECDQLEGTSQTIRIRSRCCDVRPSRSLACKTRRDQVVLYSEPAWDGEIRKQHVHRIEYLTYLIGRDMPYTGVVVEFHIDSEQLKSREVYKDGRRERSEFWLPNGQTMPKFREAKNLQELLDWHAKQPKIR